MSRENPVAVDSPGTGGGDDSFFALLDAIPSTNDSDDVFMSAKKKKKTHAAAMESAKLSDPNVRGRPSVSLNYDPQPQTLDRPFASFERNPDKNIAQERTNTPILPPPRPAENVFNISGYKVRFPVGKKPFPSQFSVMAQVLRALHQSKNALVESPTGTGKTLALLCSTLTWQQHHMLNPPVEKKVSAKGTDKGAANNLAVPPDGTITKAPPKFKKIFFTSRTHSQIAQVVNELKKCPEYITITKYGRLQQSLKTSTLGSRKHYCVNPQARKLNGGELNEKCKSLVKKHACEHRNNSKRLLTAAPPVWDIEDLVTTGQDLHACPYYGARDMVSGAHIVFAPYNYLLDPVIRHAMDINLKDAVVVIDEAHNVEDVSREAASCELTQDDLIHALEQLERMIKEETAEKLKYTQLRGVMQGVLDFVNGIASHLSIQEIQGGKKNTYEGIRSAATLKRACGMHAGNIENLRECIASISKAIAESDGGDGDQNLSGQALSACDKLVTTCEYMFANNMKYVESYRLVVDATQGWQKRVGRTPGRKTTVFKFCLWCMNPAVAFQEVADAAHSVILASGTLSPLESFASELGVEFKMRLEAKHVINLQKQLWVGAIGADSRRNSLKAVYNNTSRPQYQDALGNVLYRNIEKIPEGVLVFFPSYSLMDKVVSRWKDTGLWERIESVKRCFTEPRKGKLEMEECMEGYLEAASSSGALLFAVFRGKISEGVDFSDHNARAVFIVGIPFPAYKDLKVVLKRAYQDKQKKSGEKEYSLSGSQWYNQQAYRALNQALGRCIRHRHDYGAIFLIDPRYCDNPSVVNQLSKWVRPAVDTYHSVGNAVRSVEQFFKTLKLNPPGGVVPVPAKQQPKKQLASVFLAANSKFGKSSATAETIDVNRKPATTGAWISRKEADRSVDLAGRGGSKRKRGPLRYKRKTKSVSDRKASPEVSQTNTIVEENNRVGKLLKKRKSQESNENFGTPSAPDGIVQCNSESPIFSPGIKQYGGKAKCSRCKQWKSKEHFQHGIESSQVSLGTCLSCRIQLKTNPASPAGKTNSFPGKALRASNGPCLSASNGIADVLAKSVSAQEVGAKEAHVRHC